MSRPGTTALAAVVRRARNLFLDFDGPVCSVFAGYPAAEVAAELRHVASSAGARLPKHLSTEEDPLQVLRDVARLTDPDTTRRVADALRDAELAAIESAAPTPYASDVLVAALGSGRRLAIVSNSQHAVNAYLDRDGLTSCFSRVWGRYGD